MINQQSLFPYCQIGDPCGDTQCHKGMEVLGNSHCSSSHHGSMSYAAENTKHHHTWETHYLLEFAMGHLSRMGVISGELLRLHWDPVALLQAGPVQMHYTWNGTHTTERR